MNTTASNARLHKMVGCALFAALTAVCSQLAIPMPWGVPINLALFAVYMAGTMLGPVWGTASQVVFIALAAIGVPVLAVLLVLDLAVLAIGVACGAGGVGLIATAFIGLPMVADMLILLGGGAAVIAIALVVIWLAIWLFIRMVIGWVRLLVRLGKRWCRKEIAA